MHSRIGKKSIRNGWSLRGDWGGQSLHCELNADWPDGSPRAQQQQCIPKRHGLEFQVLNGAPYY